MGVICLSKKIPGYIGKFQLRNTQECNIFQHIANGYSSKGHEPCSYLDKKFISTRNSKCIISRKTASFSSKMENFDTKSKYLFNSGGLQDSITQSPVKGQNQKWT